jgi:hypothetical protein
MRRTALTLLAATAVLGLAACNPKSTSSTTTASAVPATTPAATSAATPPAATVPATPAGGAADPAGDVEITACEVDPTLHWPSAQVKITNKSSKSSNYIINIEFLDSSGTRIGEGLAATNNLEPGKVATQKAQGAAEANGKVSCKVAKVTRYAAP